MVASCFFSPVVAKIKKLQVQRELRGQRNDGLLFRQSYGHGGGVRARVVKTPNFGLKDYGFKSSAMQVYVQKTDGSITCPPISQVQ